MHITVKPKGKAQYEAYAPNGELICTSNTPFFTAARIMKAWGISDDTEITMSHKDSTIVSLRSTVGKAASLSVSEPDRGSIRVVPFEANPRWDDGVSIPHLVSNSGRALSTLQVG